MACMQPRKWSGYWDEDKMLTEGLGILEAVDQKWSEVSVLYSALGRQTHL